MRARVAFVVVVVVVVGVVAMIVAAGMTHHARRVEPAPAAAAPERRPVEASSTRGAPTSVASKPFTEPSDGVAHVVARDDRGAPVVGALVYRVAGNVRRVDALSFIPFAFTGADGRAACKGRPGDASPTIVYREGLRPARLPALTPGASWDVVLSDGVAFEVRVRTTEGGPAPGLRFRLSRAEINLDRDVANAVWPAADEWFEERHATTDATGRAVFAGLAPGVRTVALDAPSVAPVGFEVVTTERLLEGGLTRERTVEPLYAAVARLRVTGATLCGWCRTNGVPVPFFGLAQRPDAAALLEHRLRGRFVADVAVAVRRSEIADDLRAGRPPVVPIHLYSVDRGRKTVELRLRRPDEIVEPEWVDVDYGPADGPVVAHGRLLLVVRGPDGAEIDGVRLLVATTSPDVPPYVVARSGTALTLPAGGYGIRLPRNCGLEGVLEEGDVVVEADATTTRVLKATAPIAAAVIRVLTPFGEEAPALVTLSDARDGSPRSCFHVEGGVQWLPVGRWKVQATVDPAFDLAVDRLTIAADAAGPQRFDLLLTLR
jgi:hypothetical protein